MKRLTIRFPAGQIDEMDALAESGLYADRCEVLREAWREWREEHADRLEEAQRATEGIEIEISGRQR